MSRIQDADETRAQHVAQGRARQGRMWRRVLPAAALFLAGCNTIVDPVPYMPDHDGTLLGSVSPPQTSASILRFDSLDDAVLKLSLLSDGYRGTSNAFSRQQLAFDIPVLGIGLGLAANGAFGGSKDATVALGLSSGAVSAGRTYFAPQTKVAAYGAASEALGCMSVVASNMAAVQRRSQSDIDHEAGTLEDLLGFANGALASGAYKGTALTKEQTTALLAARDAALKAFQDIKAAQSTLVTAPMDLATLASATLRGTTKSVRAGTQNFDLALAVIAKLNSGGSAPAATPAGKTASTPSNKPNLLGVELDISPSFADLIAQLGQHSQEAAVLTKAVNDQWAKLTPCALPS